MSDDLRDAADRLATEVGHMYWTGQALEDGRLVGSVVLAWADPTPLTVETLTGLGGRVRCGDWYFGDEDSPAVVLDYHDNRECGDVYRFATGGYLPRVELTNVGELRRLLDVFGIEPRTHSRNT